MAHLSGAGENTKQKTWEKCGEKPRKPGFIDEKLEKRNMCRKTWENPGNKMSKTLGTPWNIWHFLGKPWVIFVGQPKGELGETLGRLYRKTRGAFGKAGKRVENCWIWGANLVKIAGNLGENLGETRLTIEFQFDMFHCNHAWLVVSTYPLWKIWVRELGVWFPIYGKNVPNHQTGYVRL